MEESTLARMDCTDGPCSIQTASLDSSGVVLTPQSGVWPKRCAVCKLLSVIRCTSQDPGTFCTERNLVGLRCLRLTGTGETFQKQKRVLPDGATWRKTSDTRPFGTAEA